jgi:hypothetical protein
MRYNIFGTLIAVLLSNIFPFFNINSVTDLIPEHLGETSIPFNVTVNPSFIQERQSQSVSYSMDQIPITFTLILNPNKNITYIELDSNAVIVDRENKTDQTKVSSIVWTGGTSQNQNVVFYYSSSSYYSYPYQGRLNAKGYLWDCSNCFMGKNYPYIFTFNFIYTEGNGVKQSYPITTRVPII